jgi:hypothetical protein
MDMSVDDKNEAIGGRYQVERVLGEGALGRTMLACDGERGGRRVAIKELLPSRLKRWKDLDLFHRECRTLQGLEHPGIPSYLDDFVIEDPEGRAPPRLFLVQEFVDGKSLQDHLDEGRVFDEMEVRDIARQTLIVLRYLHGLNPPAIHRDLKPANLMMRPDNSVVLIDFGAVREAVTADGIGSTIVGTFGYMPPEQYTGKSVPATDLFALGATCVQLLSGRPPSDLFEGLHHFKIPDDLPVTLGFENVLMKLTHPEVASRYASASDVLQDLVHGFLMVRKEKLTGDLPIPHRIIAAPRYFPGFVLRDAYTGRGHLTTVVLVVLGLFLTLGFPLAVAFLGQWVWLAPAIGLLLFAGALGWPAARKSWNEIGVYRRGTYALGEITGRFLSSTSMAVANLTYRYRVGNGFRHGCIATSDSSYLDLGPGDPVGVVYLDDEPEEHVLYAVPAEWSRVQQESVRQLKTHP